MRSLDAVARFHEKRTLVQIALVALLAGACNEAESSDAPAPGEPGAPRVEAPTPVRRTIPAGTSMTFRIDEAVSTETHGAGDRFTATLSANVVDVEGTPVVLEGTPSQWIVTESTTADGRSLLAIALGSVRIDGSWVPLVGTVTEARIDADGPESAGESATEIGVGTAAGALIAKVLGGEPDAMLESPGGEGSMGLVVALTTPGSTARLPAGSTVVVQLAEPVVIS